MQPDRKNIFYPPGGILIWILIGLELVTFSIALFALIYYSKKDPSLFHSSRLQLDVRNGTMNTLLLLTSGFFMANAVNALKQQQLLKAKK